MRLDNSERPYTVLRSKRKTIAIRITEDAGLEVRAPLRLPQTAIDRFVASKRDWIDAHVAAQRRRADSRASFALYYGSQVTFAGRSYPITAREGKRAGVDDEGFFLPPGLSPDEIRCGVVRIYKKLARGLFMNKVTEYAARMGLEPTAVKVTGAKTRWGSCSAKKSVSFSWRLVMADDDVIDYVVVHELAHIRELNHSAAFWAVVAGVLPDYKERRARLRALQERLSTEDWD